MGVTEPQSTILSTLEDIGPQKVSDLASLVVARLNDYSKREISVAIWAMVARGQLNWRTDYKISLVGDQ